MLREGQGHQSPHVGKVTHLFFMDDLKVYEEDCEEMEATLEMVESASQAVGMELGVRKCGVAHIQRGRVTERGGVATRLSKIRELTHDESYR